MPICLRNSRKENEENRINQSSSEDRKKNRVNNENITYEWFEQLPEQCPPKDAMPCNGVYYRIAKEVPTDSDDYFSQRKMQPNGIFIGNGVDECVLHAVSLFSVLGDAQKRLKLPKFRKQIVVKVTLTPKDGVIKKTFGTSHHSWWRSTKFEYVQVTIA